jgi:NAD(P)H-dependent FMN reductase
MQISIISASTRLNRLSHRVALALQQYIEEKSRHQVALIDLAAYNFPIMEEVLHRHPNPPAGLLEFAEKIRQTDAVVFVSPEYNGSYTAALKNAVDYLKESEFSGKVIGVSSVSTGALGGMRAAMNLQELVLGVSGYPIPQMLNVGNVATRFDEQGILIDPGFEKNLNAFISKFLWLAEAVHEKKFALVQANQPQVISVPA